MSGRGAGFLAHLANFLLLMAMWGLALWAYDALPDTIPVHFDAAGAPDRIVPRTYTSWLMLPGSAAGMTVLLYLSALFVPLRIDHPLWMIGFLLLTAVTFSLFGFVIGLWADGFEKLQVVPMMIKKLKE